MRIFAVEVTYLDDKGNKWKELDRMAYKTREEAEELQKYLSNEEVNQSDLETYGERVLESEIIELVVE